MRNVQAPVGASVLAAALALVFVLMGFLVPDGTRLGFWAVALVLIPAATALLAVVVRRLRGE